MHFFKIFVSGLKFILFSPTARSLVTWAAFPFFHTSVSFSSPVCPTSLSGKGSVPLSLDFQLPSEQLFLLPVCAAGAQQGWSLPLLLLKHRFLSAFFCCCWSSSLSVGLQPLTLSLPSFSFAFVFSNTYSSFSPLVFTARLHFSARTLADSSACMILNVVLYQTFHALRARV